MAMNGRQKAMTGALMGGAPRRTATTRDIGLDGIEPLKLLKYIVEECEKGNFAIRNLSTEMFQDPRSYAGMVGNAYERMLIRGDQFLAVNMEIAPSGRVKDIPRTSTSNPDDDIGDGYVEFNEYGDVVDRVPPSRPAFDQYEKPKTETPKPPPTPAGASAARDIIFDDNGSDPT